MGDDSVVTGEYAIASARLKCLPALHIGNLDFFRSLGVSEILNMYGSATEAQSHRRVVPVQPRIVEGRADNIFHGLAGRDAGNQPANKKPRNRGIPVGKVIDVRLVAATPELIDQSLNDLFALHTEHEKEQALWAFLIQNFHVAFSEAPQDVTDNEMRKLVTQKYFAFKNR